MTVSSLHAVAKSIVVNVSQERAFRVFTEGFNRWWPHAHHIGDAPIKKAVLEPRAGGRWYEIGEDDSECDWGQVKVYAPFAHLLLIWQINGDWRFDPAFETEVEVRFVVESSTRTRVELEHRNLERFGAKENAITDAFKSPQGWTGMLAEFRTVAEATEV